MLFVKFEIQYLSLFRLYSFFRFSTFYLFSAFPPFTLFPLFRLLPFFPAFPPFALFSAIPFPIFRFRVLPLPELSPTHITNFHLRRAFYERSSIYFCVLLNPPPTLTIVSRENAENKKDTFSPVCDCLFRAQLGYISICPSLF